MDHTKQTMGNCQKLGFTALALLALATSGFAAGNDVIKVKGLGVLHGEVVAWDAANEVLTFKTNEGKQHVIKAADLDRLSAYKLAKSKADRESAEDQLKLGNFARTIELYAYAGRHYESAIKLDASLTKQVEKEQAINRSQAAAYSMRQARAAEAKGDGHGAEKWLKILVDKLPDQPEAATAAAMLSKHYEKNHAAKDDVLEGKYSGELQKDLKKGKKAYDDMLEKIRDGLTNSRSTGAAKKKFEGAWKDGEKALSELERVQKKKGKDDKNLAELFDGYRELIHEHMVEAQLHLAAQYSIQTSYNQALKEVNKALSIDGKNRDALAARARLEDAVSNGGLFRRWW